MLIYYLVLGMSFLFLVTRAFRNTEPENTLPLVLATGYIFIILVFCLVRDLTEADKILISKEQYEAKVIRDTVYIYTDTIYKINN